MPPETREVELLLQSLPTRSTFGKSLLDCGLSVATDTLRVADVPREPLAVVDRGSGLWAPESTKFWL
jgi:hypothetical protein